MYSKTILVGNLGQDPEMAYTQDGLAICKFSLATSEIVKKEKQTSWHRCVSFGKIAENIGKFCKKGTTLLVDGRIQYGKYENKDGNTVYTTDIIVNTFKFVGKKENSGGGQQQPVENSSGRDDEIPF
jgi:single-strand DNA-binding protein